MIPEPQETRLMAPILTTRSIIAGEPGLAFPGLPLFPRNDGEKPLVTMEAQPVRQLGREQPELAQTAPTIALGVRWFQGKHSLHLRGQAQQPAEVLS